MAITTKVSKDVRQFISNINATKYINELGNTFSSFLISNVAFSAFINSTSLRKLILKRIQKILSRDLLEDPNFPVKVQQDKLDMFIVFAKAINKAFENIRNSKELKKTLIYDVGPYLVKSISRRSEIVNNYKKEYGYLPPNFITISPGKFCNLKCTGCYANSSANVNDKLPFDVVDRIIKEKKEIWGSWFTVISGGEPLLWKDNDKTIFDIAKKHNDNLFLMYTNGTLIDEEMAKRFVEVGNITCAISVEGYEKDTDQRRGKGVHKQILKAMENLSKYHIPFGISLTATRLNASFVPSQEILDYYWDKGAIYAWLFQLMPIGRGSFDLIVTPEQRLDMFKRTQELVRKGYFIVDFWNSGIVTNGCISAGRPSSGYFYIDWNGNVTPCVFNPYAFANIIDIYNKNGNINDLLNNPFVQQIREWQKNYGWQQPKEKIQNWTLPCIVRDHYEDFKKILDANSVIPIDEDAKNSMNNNEYYNNMISYDSQLKKYFDPLWEKEYKE